MPTFASPTRHRQNRETMFAGTVWDCNRIFKKFSGQKPEGQDSGDLIKTNPRPTVRAGIRANRRDDRHRPNSLSGLAGESRAGWFAV